MIWNFATLLAVTTLAACSSDPHALAKSASIASVAPGALVSASPISETDEPRDFAPAPANEPSPVPPSLAIPPPSGSKPGPVVGSARASLCDIRIEHTVHGVLLTALANSDRPGVYSFLIAKRGESGSSDINQGGPFEAGQRVELGASEVSLDRSSSYRATLILTSHGREVCRRTVRS